VPSPGCALLKVFDCYYALIIRHFCQFGVSKWMLIYSALLTGLHEILMTASWI